MSKVANYGLIILTKILYESWVVYGFIIFVLGDGVVEEKHHWNIISILVLFLTEVLSSEVECD